MCYIQLHVRNAQLVVQTADKGGPFRMGHHGNRPLPGTSSGSVYFCFQLLVALCCFSGLLLPGPLTAVIKM